ncbi:MAG: YetF domain-containing protein [Ignavibacteria bacterium]|jgi:uncharacterized membrane protein YcaP (DUF421 family)
MLQESLDIIIRSVIVYLFIVVAIRLFGKKEIAQLSVVDLVFILLISNAVQNAMVGPSTSLYGGLVAAFALFVVNFIFKNLLFRSKKFTDILEGHATMLVYRGKVVQKNLESSKISMEELESAVREHGVMSIGDVDLAVLEIDGNISVLSEDFRRKTTRRRKAHKVLTKEV